MELRNAVTFHVFEGKMCHGLQKQIARRGKEIRIPLSSNYIGLLCSYG